MYLFPQDMCIGNPILWHTHFYSNCAIGERRGGGGFGAAQDIPKNEDIIPMSETLLSLALNFYFSQPNNSICIGIGTGGTPILSLGVSLSSLWDGGAPVLAGGVPPRHDHGVHPPGQDQWQDQGIFPRQDLGQDK